MQGEEGAEVELFEDVVVEVVGCYEEEEFGGEGGDGGHWVGGFGQRVWYVLGFLKRMW